MSNDKKESESTTCQNCKNNTSMMGYEGAVKCKYSSYCTQNGVLARPLFWERRDGECQ